MSAQKACGRDIIWTVVLIGFKLDVVVRWLFRMIWSTFWGKNIKSKMADRGYFKKMATQKTCGRDILWNVGWIAFKFAVVVIWVFVMIWLTFGKNPLKTRWPMARKACGHDILWTIGWIAFKLYAVVLSPCPFRSDRQSNLDNMCAL